jgi:hypothetical protein
MPVPSHKTQVTSQYGADLHWLVFLLTGQRELSIDITVEAAISRDDANSFLDTWMQAWSRKMVIANARAVIRHELAESAHRTELASIDRWKVPPREWSLDPGTTKAQNRRRDTRDGSVPQGGRVAIGIRRGTNRRSCYCA